MRNSRRRTKKINSKVVLIVFFITMFFFGTSYAILHQELVLNGTVGIYIDEGTDLTITNFNRNIDVIYTQYILGFIPVSGYKVVGITIQNPLSKTINNWTVEFTSNRNAETNRPTDNRLSAYLNPENYYSSVTNSNGTVIVRGNDTLAPGATKTVYVFFAANLLNNNYNFSNERAYYTPDSGRRNAPARNTMGATPSLREYDEITTENFAIHITYDTELVADNLYSTTMYVFIGNNTGSDISNIKFDVAYNSSNLSNISSSTINILSNNENSASFLCSDVIPNQDVRGYIVTGMRTYGGFDGMTISNFSYDNVTND